MLNKLVFILAICGAAMGSARAAGPEAPAAAPGITAEQFEATLKFEAGKIDLPGGKTTLSLPANFRYLSPTETSRVLEAWGNPPDATSMGMIVPANTALMSQAGWGVVVTYEADGHVKDDDADSIKYDELLKDMQEGTQAANEERKKLGYPAMNLVGWAETPTYDKATHKMYWAKELRAEGAAASGLNYNIRVLGREGVLVLNAVASMDQIDTIKREMKTVTAFSDFTAGNRYTDYNSATDKAAEYGLAALVAGGVASKLGLFGKLLALLIAFKKIIIIAVGAAGVGLFNFFRGKSASKVNLDK